MAEDTGKMERYTVPPGARVTSQESGLSRWESVMSREEVENWEGIFGAPYHKAASKGGGEGPIDSIFDSPEHVSPEALLLLKEFIQEKYHTGSLEELLKRRGWSTETANEELKPDFLSWLSGDHKEEFRYQEEEHFTPTELVLDPSGVSFDVVDFKELWRSPKTKVTYLYHPGGKGGHLVFDGTLSSGKKAKIEVRLGELAKSAFGRKIFFGCPRTDEERDVFGKKLKSLTLEDRPLASPEIEFVYPIELSLDRRAIYRKMSPAMAKKVSRFDYAWRKGGQVESVGFGFREGGIVNVALELSAKKENRIIALPFDVFRTAYRVLRFNGRENGRYAEGGDFGGIAAFTPATPADTFLDIAASMSINGVRLPARTRVVVADFSPDREAVGTTIGYT